MFILNILEINLYSLLQTITTTLVKLHKEGILVTICRYGEIICKPNRLPGEDTTLPNVITLNRPLTGKYLNRIKYGDNSLR